MFLSENNAVVIVATTRTLYVKEFGLVYLDSLVVTNGIIVQQLRLSVVLTRLKYKPMHKNMTD